MFYGKTKKECYEHLEISRQAFYYKLKGKRQFTKSEIRRLGRFLKVNVAVLTKDLESRGAKIKKAKKVVYV